jgi:hypothetical protein
METNGQIVKAEQLLSNLGNSLPEQNQSISEISLYKGQLTTKKLIEGVSIIQKSFPSLPISFYEIFKDRIKANNFTDERLMDSITNVIDTCVYPTPTIAQFISFDKRVKVYKYPEIVKMVDDDPNAFDRYKRIVMEGLPEAVWIHVNDIAKYNIKSITSK